MSSIFHALDLPSGEAFLLKTTRQSDRQFCVLVDSGTRKRRGKQHPLVQAIRRVEPELKRIDVAICTHQDNDHAGGFADFADHWYSNGNAIGEFWLPGRWAAAFPDAIANPLGVMDRLYNGASELLGTIEDNKPRSNDTNVDVTNALTLECNIRTHDNLRLVSSAFEECAIPANIPETEESISSKWDRLALSFGILSNQLDLLITQDEVNYGFDKVSSLYPGKHCSYCFLLSHLPARMKVDYLYLRAIDTLNSIRNIASAALRFIIPIRWFDFGLFEQTTVPRGGIKQLLLPLNSVEIGGPPRVINDLALFLSLHLSIHNVESLVFLREETLEEPATLFLGDSRLNFGIGKLTKNFSLSKTPPKRTLLMTAPHHGSRVNDNAYSVIDQWLGVSRPDIICIRNGGRDRQTFNRYMTIHKKACVQCHSRYRCTNYTFQFNGTVTVGTDHTNAWQWPPVSGRQCPALQP